MKLQRPKDDSWLGRRLAAQDTEGNSLYVQGYELVPLVRVIARGKRRAALRSDRVSAQGGGWVHMRPVAVLARNKHGERYHEIVDQTTRRIHLLVLLGLLISCLSAVIIRLSAVFGGQES